MSLCGQTREELLQLGEPKEQKEDGQGRQKAPIPAYSQRRQQAEVEGKQDSALK
jgi:hypothetical protein